MPKGFYFLNPDVLLWRPLAFTPEQKSDEQRHSNSWQHIAPPQAGRQLAARAAADRRAQRAQPRAVPAVEAAPDQRRLPHRRSSRCRTPGPRRASDAVPDVGRRAVRAPHRLRERRQSRARPSRARLKELATRLALGAGSARLARQLVTESVLLTPVAAAAGLASATARCACSAPRTSRICRAAKRSASTASSSPMTAGGGRRSSASSSA